MQLERLELAYSIELIRTAESAEPEVYITVERHSHDGPMGTPKKVPLATFKQVAEMAGAVQEALSGSLGLIGDRHPAHSGWLASHLRNVLIPRSQQLTELLIPSFVAEMIRDSACPIPIEFRVDPMLNQVPWEALYVGRDFLAFSHATGRHVMSNTGSLAVPRRQQTESLRGAFLVDPCPIGEHRLAPALVKASREVMGRWWNGPGADRIQFDAGGVCVDAAVSPQRMISVLRDHDVVVTVGHHSDRRRAPTAAPELEGLVIADPTGTQPELFSPQAFIEALRPPHLPPELVFWLACESGLTTGWEADWPRMDRIYGFVDAAIRAGVPHFIGSSLLIPQIAAADLIEPFLLALASGCSVGESLRQARLAARCGNPDPAGGGSLVGLAFSLFGRPSQGLVSAQGWRIPGMLAGRCQHTVDLVRCVKLFHPLEEGAKDRRCADHSLLAPPPPPIPREPCADPYARHPNEVIWVSQTEDGWEGAMRRGGRMELVRLCSACRSRAWTLGELVRLEDLG